MSECKHLPQRKKFIDIRSGLTRKVQACGMEFYLTVNFFDDTMEPGEVFIKIAKQGSTIAGFVDAWVTTLSISLQYGVPWDVLMDKYLHHRFEPSDDKNPSLIHAMALNIDSLIKEKKDLWSSDVESRKL